MADEYDTGFLFKDDYQERLQAIAEAERRIAQNDATFKSIPTRMEEVVKDKKGKRIDTVEYEVSQGARKAMARGQRDKMIENANTRAAIEKAEAIPPKYTKEVKALYKLGVADGDIAALQAVAEAGDVPRLSSLAAKIGEAISQKRFGNIKETALDDKMRATRDAMKGELFGALGTFHDRAMQMARGAGRPTSSFITPQSEAAGNELSLTNEEGISPAVAQSPQGGSRAFTNIGTPGGEIQEVMPDGGLVRVKRMDGAIGYVPEKMLTQSPGKYTPYDETQEALQGPPEPALAGGNPATTPSAPGPSIAGLLQQGSIPPIRPGVAMPVLPQAQAGAPMAAMPQMGGTPFGPPSLLDLRRRIQLAPQVAMPPVYGF